MAARKLRPFHTDEIRAKIQASQLINRLTDHAFDKVELSSTQLKAIEILLRKSVHDLSTVQLTGQDGGPVETVIKIELLGVRPK